MLHHSEDSTLLTSLSREDVSSAWLEFVTAGRVSSGRVRPHIERAWIRSRTAGCDPRAMVAQRLDPSETQDLLRKERVLIESARPYMVALSRAAGGDRHAAMLADRHAVVLEVIGDLQTVHDPNFPAAGSVLTEAVAGSNGIGTVLAENAYAEVVGPEHYIEGFHPFTCQGVPILGPDNEVVGVLSTSVRRTEAAERIHEILLCATHGLEAELRRRRLEASLEKMFQGGPRGGLTDRLTRLREDIVQFQTASWLQLQTAAELVCENEMSEALSLVEVATRLAGQFKKQADLWLGLADDTVRGPVPVRIEQKIQEMAALLQTEAAVREISLRALGTESESVMNVDWIHLSRSVFRNVLLAFEWARAGGDVGIRWCPQPEDPRIRIEARTLTGGPEDLAFVAEVAVQ